MSVRYEYLNTIFLSCDDYKWLGTIFHHFITIIFGIGKPGIVLCSMFLHFNSACTANILHLRLIPAHIWCAVQVGWEVLGPSSEDPLPPHNGDFAEPVSGTLSFRDGEGGVRSIILRVCPHEEAEAEETFIVQLKSSQGAKLDPRATTVTLTVSLNTLPAKFHI